MRRLVSKTTEHDILLSYTFVNETSRVQLMDDNFTEVQLDTAILSEI